MQSLASLLHGDCIEVRRSEYQVCFLHPRGWNYYATLRRELVMTKHLVRTKDGIYKKRGPTDVLLRRG